MESSPGIARRLLCGMLLTLCASTAMPQTASLYTVEIVVFRNSGASGALADVAAPAAVADDGVDATSVPTSKLNSAVRKLRGNPDFKVLAHSAWTQSPTPWPETTAWNLGLGVSATRLGINNGITGKIFLERGKFLDLGVDLTVEDGGHRYRITEVRNVKLNEIHYFDRPSIGVLAIVTAASGG